MCSQTGSKPAGSSGYMSAASHYLTGDIGVLPFNHGLTLKGGSPSSASPRSAGGSYAAYCLYLTVTSPACDALAAGLLELLNNPRRTQLGADGRAFIQNLPGTKPIGRYMKTV